MRLFHELMQHHDALTGLREEKHPRDTLCCLEPQLKEPFLHRPRMRHAEARAKSNHSISKMDVSSEQSCRQCENVALHDCAVIPDRPVHAGIIALVLYQGTDEIAEPAEI